MKNCLNCGAPNDDDAKFCLRCGQSLEAAAGARPAVEDILNAPAAAEESQEAFYARPEDPTVWAEPQPAPKKKKTGLIVGLCAAAVVLIAAIGAAVFLLLNQSPQRKLEKAFEKSAKALEEAVGETGNLEKAMENMRALDEAKADSKRFHMNFREGDEDYFTAVSFGISGDYDSVNKIMAGEGSLSITDSDEEGAFDLAVKISADDEKLMISVPRFLDTVLSVRTKELGKDLRHLEELGVADFGGVDDTASVDLFSANRNFNYNELMEKIKTECGEEGSAFAASIVLGKGESRALDYGGTYTAYPVTFRYDALSAYLDAVFETVSHYYLDYFAATFDPENSIFPSMMLNGSFDAIQEEIPDSFDEAKTGLLDIIRELEEENIQYEVLVNAGGYWAGFRFYNEEREAAFLLLGEENPWSGFALYDMEDGEAEPVIRGGLTNENGAFALALTLDEDGALELRYNDGTGDFSASITADGETWALSGAFAPTRAGCELSLEMDIQNDWTPVSFDMSISVGPLSDTPTHVSGSALALGEATEEDLMNLMMEFYQKLMSDPELGPMIGMAG